MTDYEGTPVKTRRKRKSISVARVKDAETTAAVMVEMVDGLGQSLVGEPGALSPTERALIEPPLGRILARSDPDKLGQYAGLIDPFLLGIGLLLYLSRVNQTINPPKVGEGRKNKLPFSQKLVPTGDSDPREGGRLYQTLDGLKAAVE